LVLDFAIEVEVEVEVEVLKYFDTL